METLFKQVSKEKIFYLNQFKDNLFLDFIDSYNNLTFKTLGIFTWIEEKIKIDLLQTKWILKADDDIAINFDLLLNELKELEPPKHQFQCHIRYNAWPNRNPVSKW